MRRQSHLGVYALIRAKGHTALILKSRGPYAGSWDLPGGKIEFGEAPIQALAREVREEVDLRILTATPLDILSIRASFESETGAATDLHHIGIVFACEVSAPDELRHTGDGQDVSESRWFPPSEVQELNLTPLAHAVLKQDEQGGGAFSGNCHVSSLHTSRLIRNVTNDAAGRETP